MKLLQIQPFWFKNSSLQVVYLQICYKCNQRDVESVCYLSVILKKSDNVRTVFKIKVWNKFVLLFFNGR